MLQGQAAPEQAAGSGTEDEDKCTNEEGQVRARGWQEEVGVVRVCLSRRQSMHACSTTRVYIRMCVSACACVEQERY